MSQRTSNFSKRTRFEIFRRDNHTCRYCGAKAPDVELQADHVVPVALGGTNDPSNGVTACIDCNQGKASIPADAEVVEEARTVDKNYRDALRKNLIQQTEETISKRQEDDAWVKTMTDYWCDRVTFEKTYPAGMEKSLLRWRDLGCPDSLITYCMDIAGDTDHLIGMTKRQRSYTCGIIWKRIEMASKEASNV